MSIYVNILILIIFILWQFIPNIFIWVYLAFILTFLFIIVAPQFMFRNHLDRYKEDVLKILTHDEYEYLKKNAAFCLYPFAARMYSAVCSFLYLSGLLFTTIFLFRALWVHAIICALNIIIFAPLARYINRPFFVFDTLHSHGLLYWSEERQSMRVKELKLWRGLQSGNIENDNFRRFMDLAKQAKMIDKINEFMKKEWSQISSKGLFSQNEIEKAVEYTNADKISNNMREQKANPEVIVPKRECIRCGEQELLHLGKYCSKCFKELTSDYNNEAFNRLVDKEITDKENIFKILILDDAPSVFWSYEMIYAVKGMYYLKWAIDSEGALKLLENEPFDLFITDRIHPGMKGEDLLEYIKGKHPYMQRLLITGYATEQSHAKAIAAGALEYLRMPFLMEEIFKLTERAKKKNEIERAKKAQEGKGT